MRLEIDARGRQASASFPRSMYSLEAIRIAAHILSDRAEALLAESRAAFEVTLKPKSRTPDPAGLRALMGEFANELLNQEYRFLVGAFNKKITGLIVTQALYAARGGEAPPAPPAESPELKAELDKLVEEAREEIARTMPKRIAPQGPPIPRAPRPARG